MRKEFRNLISLEEARSRVLEMLPAAEEVQVSLRAASGMVLAEKVVAGIDVPGFSRASMDGYAVRAEDTLGARDDRPKVLDLAGTVPMGALAELQVCSNQAVEVSTGSMMPEGSDAVVMVEYCDQKDHSVWVRRPVHRGENVQSAGSDISFGETVLFPGTILTSRELGVLAALGRERVRVRRLKVGIASTGNELVPPGRPLEPGQIYDINTYSISSAVQECGGEPAAYGILPDRREAMAEVLQTMARECSLLLVSGSTSAGAGDMIYQVLDDIGTTFFHGINLKPGKPTIFASIGGKPCLGLPGYPTSALTVFRLLAAPVIGRALGRRYRGHLANGRLARPVRSESRRQMLAVGMAGKMVYPMDRGSGSITTLAQADGVVEIPAEVEYLDRGEQLSVQLFSEEPFDLTVVGESCPVLETILEDVPFQVRYLIHGGQRGLAALEDGAADLACVSLQKDQKLDLSPGCVSISGYNRNLGLMAKDPKLLCLQDGSAVQLLGWARDSAMNEALGAALKELGLAADDVRLQGQVKSHSAVAQSVAFGRALLGFGAEASAREAGLFFRGLIQDRVEFVCRSADCRMDAAVWLWSYLSSDAFRQRLPAGVNLI